MKRQEEKMPCQIREENGNDTNLLPSGKGKREPMKSNIVGSISLKRGFSNIFEKDRGGVTWKEK